MGMTYVDKYIHDTFDNSFFKIEEEPAFFQGKKVMDQHGDFLIVEGIPFKNSILVHDKNKIDKFIFDEKMSDWIFENQ